MKPIAIFAVLGAFVTGTTAKAEQEDISSEPVSIINLIATPDKFHGKRIVITAYATTEFENMSLCMTEPAVSSKDCLWLDIATNVSGSDSDSDRWLKINDAWKIANHQVITIHGTFDKNDTGHFGGWSGGIKDVTRVYGKDFFINFTTFPPIVIKRSAK